MQWCALHQHVRDAGWRRLLLALAVLLASRCGAPSSPTDTGLAGTVLRGPVTPVCRVDQPCDEPFSATFTVRQDGRTVTTFHSDTKGHFEFRIAPGQYLVVPAPDAPIISPAMQVKQVEVASSGLTAVVLQFDTGIR
jgi:hypothetical protein